MEKEEFRKLAKEECGYSDKDIEEIIEMIEDSKSKGMCILTYEDFLIVNESEYFIPLHIMKKRRNG